MSIKVKSAARPGRTPGPSTDKLVEMLAQALSLTETQRLQALNNKYLMLRDVVGLTTLSKTQLYRMVKAGKFPKPVPISEGRKAWLVREVQMWMAEKSEGRESGP